jgi:hypothetical protein
MTRKVNSDAGIRHLGAVAGSSRTQRDPAWKDFYIRNPWAPFSILREMFGIRQYDLDNFRRKPQCQEIIGNAWSLSAEQTPERVRVIIASAFKYYLSQELGLDYSSEASIPKILRINAARAGLFSFLWEPRNLGKLDGYIDWIALGYTRTSFLVLNIFPGQEWAQRIGLLPVMFWQTSKKAVCRNELVGLLEFVYIRHLQKLASNASIEEIEGAKRIFCIRHNERGFMSFKQLREFGVTPNLTSNNIVDVLDGLAKKFRVDLGIDSDPSLIGWSSGEYRKRFPSVETSACHYCRRGPVDLHHLISRAEDPSLTYDSENVVPLCVAVHAKITRNNMSADQREGYLQATDRWLKSAKGERKIAFSLVMGELHRDVYG